MWGEINTAAMGALRRWNERVNINAEAPDKKIKTTVTEFLKEDPNFPEREIIPTFSAIIDSYNALEITPENINLFLASAKLKEKIPQLPNLKTLTAESRSGFHSRWTRNFLKAVRVMDQAMAAGEKAREENPTADLFSLDLSGSELLFNYSPTQPPAIVAGAAYHVYEETILQDQELRGQHKWVKDEIVDALVEMLIAYHQDARLFQLTKNPWSEDDTGGLDWVNAYEHFSQKLRQMAECK